MSPADDFDEFVEADTPALPAHLYFHVPFCSSKCSYCDFNSFSGRDPQEVFAVFTGMAAEVRRWSASTLPGVVETVYVGGGTPSLHAAAVGHLLDHVRHDLEIRPDAEITVEANPESLTPAALDALLEGGANRISVGVQAFDDGVLGLLGRAHDAHQARSALATVRESGVELSIDLICGVPGQSVASWVESLEQALDAGAKHLSVYPLAVEEGTPLAAAVSGGIVPEPDPDVAAEMMLLAQERLARAGLIRYEVANYAIPGHESRHNTAYWTGSSYVGTGPGAHGMLDPATARTVGLYITAKGARDMARIRYANEADIDRWLMGAPPQIEVLSLRDAAREDVMLGMRLARGAAVQQVEAAGLGEVLRSLADDGLVESHDARWSTTTRGWLLGNVVFGRIWNAE